MLDSALIKRPSVNPDGLGGTERVWSTMGTVRCRVAVNASGESTVLAGQIVEKAPWRVTFPALTDIRTTDRVVVKGKTLEVVGVAASSTFETARVTYCAEV